MRGSPLLLLLPPPHAMCSVVIFNEQRTLQRRGSRFYSALWRQKKSQASAAGAVAQDLATYYFIGAVCDGNWRS